MKKFLSITIAVIMLLIIAACGQGAEPDASAGGGDADTASPEVPETITDSYGNEFEVPMNLERIIVINSSVYEMICVLGKDDIVIGVGDTTTYPASAETKEKYGDWKEPNVEKIMEAKPDAVVGYSSYLDSGIAKQLTDAGIPVIMLDFYVPSEIPAEVEMLGKMLGAEEQASEFLSDIAEIQTLVTERTKDVERINVYYEGYGDYKSVGKGSGGTELMELANVKSLTADEDTAYPEISDEWILEANPQMMIKLVSNTKDILGENIENDTAVKEIYSTIVNRPGWSAIDAVINGKILILSSRIGTNPLGTAMAPLYIAKTAYPDKFEDIDPDEYLNDLLEKYWGTGLTGIWSYTE